MVEVVVEVKVDGRGGSGGGDGSGDNGARGGGSEVGGDGGSSCRVMEVMSSEKVGQGWWGSLAREARWMHF